MANNEHMSDQDAWQIIRRHYELKAHEAFGQFLITRTLTLEPREPHEPVYPLLVNENLTICYVTQHRIFTRGNNEVGHLSNKPHMVFVDMLSHPDILRTHEQLFVALFPNTDCNEASATVKDNVSVAIKRIRDELAHVHPELPSIIATVKQMGYMYTPLKPLEIGNQRI